MHVSIKQVIVYVKGMTYTFECSMGDKHVVQAVIFEGRLAGALEEMQLIYNMVYRRHTNPHI